MVIKSTTIRTVLEQMELGNYKQAKEILEYEYKRHITSEKKKKGLL